jgi:four helix bundle protein
MKFEEWTRNVPRQLRSDLLWKSKYNQLGMFLYDKTWEDCVQLREDFRGKEVSRQLIRSVGSICANMEEAYGRRAGTADRRRVFRIALGEARESKGWYLRARHILPQDVLESRLEILDQIISLLVSIIYKKKA